MTEDFLPFQSAQLNLEAPLPPYLRHLKEKNQKLAQKRQQKKQSLIQKKSIDNEVIKQDKNDKKNENLLKSNKNAQKHNELNKDLLNTLTNNSSLKRKRDLLPESLINEYVSKKRTIEIEEKLVEEADIDLSRMRNEVLKQTQESKKIIFKDALRKGEDIEVVYHEEISNPMDMPIQPANDIANWLHTHFFQLRSRISSAAFVKGKQYVRSFTPAHNFATLAKKNTIKSEKLEIQNDKQAEILDKNEIEQVLAESEANSPNNIEEIQSQHNQDNLTQIYSQENRFNLSLQDVSRKQKTIKSKATYHGHFAVNGINGINGFRKQLLIPTSNKSIKKAISLLSNNK